MSNNSNKQDQKKPAMSSSSGSSGLDGIQDDAAPMPSMPASENGGAALSKAGPYAVQKQLGYPLAIIVNGKADEKFCCCHCKNILRNPMQNTCGHRYCQDCLKIMETSPQPLQCQACVEEGNVDEDSILKFLEMFEDKAARREMKKLAVKCVSPGCHWKGIFSDYEKHEEECDKKKVRCSQCGTDVSKARLHQHETKSCPKRVIQCNYCREQIVFEFRDKHNEECPKFLVKCEKCGTNVERSKLLIHQQTVCANRVVTCPCNDCQTKLPMSKFLTHISKDETLAKHIVHLLDKTEDSEQRLQRLENGSFSTSSQHRADASSSSSHPHPPPSATSQSHHASAGYTAEASLQYEASIDMGEGAQAEGGFIEGDRQKLKLHEDLMSVLHSEILRCITKGEALGRGMEKSENRVRDCYAKIETIFTRLNALEANSSGGSRRSPPDQTVETGELNSEGTGTFTWIIRNYTQVKQEATQRDREVICSPTFFSCPGGYHLRLKLYANGEGNDNRNKNVSLFVQLVKGPSDDLLVWPFSPRIHFMLVDQADFQQHHNRVYEADPMSPASIRPSDDTGGVSIACGCPAFISVKDMTAKKNRYWPKDTLYLKFHIQIPERNMDRLNSLHPLGSVMTAASTVRS